ncbi:GNAT family N-acetyltransferase [Oerskovia flava]|uniref:GNAT family N-acetyltransferase n=1 Tax=Oerskovia flava TaxID=2986422 RepID=UPI002240AFB6|nr:GNAT family N-acetyltransferase [Oerskovia sp. JB1-3-2]
MSLLPGTRSHVGHVGERGPAPRDVSRTTVRLARPSEHADVGALLVDAYTHDYTISAAYLASLREVAPRAAEHEVWVAAEAQAPGSQHEAPTQRLLGTVVTPRAGGAPLSPLARAGELDFRLLGVAPSARGGGVGELLTRHVLALARERRYRRVVMNSGPQMTGAHRLYARLGFRRLPERETRVVDGDVRLLAFGIDL